MAILKDLEKRISYWFARRSMKATGLRDWWSGLVGSGSGGFAGANVNRLTFSQPQSSNAVNADLDGQLEILRARARALAANNEFAKRFLNLVATNIVGPNGPTLVVRAYQSQPDPKKPPVIDKAANDAIEAHWKRWGKAADITGKMSLSHLLRVAAKAAARDGETLVRIVRDRSLPYGIALQILEADRLDVALNKKLDGGGMIRQGVELTSDGRPVAYWLRKSHPGDRQLEGKAEYERVLARDIRHIALWERAEQVRGYTWMHAVLPRMPQLQGFEESAVVAARVGASKVAALIPGEGSNAGEQLGDAQDSAGNFQVNAEPGDLFEVPPGYDLKSWDPQYPHENFEAFVTQCLRALAAGLDVAAHNLTANMRDVNYSSARIAELAEREVWMILQGWFIDSLLTPVYRAWLETALLLGQITFEQSGKSLPADKLPKFVDVATFRGRRWQWVDPEKEANASEKLITLGLASRTELAADKGRDFEDIVAELQAEREALEAAGLPVTGEVPKPAPAPDPAATATATGKAVAEAIGALKVPEVKVENHVDARPPEVNNTVEAHLPSADVEIAGRVEDAARVLEALPEVIAEATKAQAEATLQLAAAVEQTAKAQARTEKTVESLLAEQRKPSVPVYDAKGKFLGIQKADSLERMH